MHDNPTIPLLLALSLILCAARLAGAAARKLGQPRVLGELLIGVALGPTLVDLLHWRALSGGHLAGTIKELAELGVLILMFNIALEIRPRELMAVGRTALYAGVLGAAVPLGVIALLTWAFGFPTHVALLTGVVMSANSTSISAQTLLELGVLRTKEGNAMLATALVDDVLAIMLVSVSVALTGGTEETTWLGIGWVVLRMLLFFAAAGFVAWSILPRVMNAIHITPGVRAALRGTDLRANLCVVSRLERGGPRRRGRPQRHVPGGLRSQPDQRAGEARSRASVGLRVLCLPGAHLLREHRIGDGLRTAGAVGAALRRRR